MKTVPERSTAMPRGIAFKYHRRRSGDTTMVKNSFKFFPGGDRGGLRDCCRRSLRDHTMPHTE